MRTSSGFPRRTALRFSVEHLSLRDETLLKSLVRVLDHRTHQHWECVEQDADLLITTRPASAAARHVLAVLSADAGAGASGHCLELPLNAEQIEAQLNRIGDAIASAHGGASLAAASPAGAPVAKQEYRLRQWPPAALLTSGQRMQMATVLSARPMSVPALQARTGASEQTCSDFLAELGSAGCLELLPLEDTSLRSATGIRTPPTASPQPAPEPGLFARIRSRLGLQPAWQR